MTMTKLSFRIKNPFVYFSKRCFYISLRNFVFILSIVLVEVSAIYESTPFIKYVKYTVPFLAIGYLFFANTKYRIYLSSIKICFPFVFLILCAMLNSLQIDFNGLKDIFFIAASFILFAICKPKSTNLFKINFIFIFAYILLRFNNFDFQNGQISLLKSESFVIDEDNYSSLMGLFTIYSAYNGHILLFILNLALGLIDQKRIATLSVIIVLCIMPLQKRFKNSILNPIVMVLFNLILIVLLVLFTQKYFDPFINNILEIRPDVFAMGRNWIYKGVVDEIQNHTFHAVTIGFGWGSVYPLAIKSGVTLCNLHSDILKIFFENGAIVFIGFFYLLYNTKNRLVNLLSLYLNINFIADNILIFTHVMFFYFLLCHQIYYYDSLPERRLEKV
jgi:hypothetical protein